MVGGYLCGDFRVEPELKLFGHKVHTIKRHFLLPKKPELPK